MSQTPESTRRTFIKSAIGAGVAAVAVPGTAWGQDSAPASQPEPPKEKQYPQLRVAYIGTGGIGGHHLDELGKLGITCPCFCDVDKTKQVDAAKQYPAAKAYQDYRQMFDKESKNFDAVIIGTPDHHHYPATVMAMKLGKHAYTQKPLTHTVWEARELTKLAATTKVATQMGNQHHAGEGWRLVYEFIHGGAMGDITAVHTWTDRPIWPQGMDRPKEEDAVPADLDWDCWLGPAPKRPFKNRAYHWFNWRGWSDFGTGALGDMACHTMDGMFWALAPGHPKAIEPIACGVIGESYPRSAMVKWEFAGKPGKPPLSVYWYDGGLMPALPAELELGRKLSPTGNIFVGTKASMLVSGDYGESPRIFPEAKMKEIGRPKQILERSPGHFKEWVMACVGEKPLDFPKSNFSYAGPLTECMLLGNVAQKVRRRLEWDGEAFKFTNLPDANQFLTKEYRDGWKV